MRAQRGEIRKKDTSQTLSIDMDDEVIPGMNKGPEEMAQEICLAAVGKWYELDMMSQGKADEMSW